MSVEHNPEKSIRRYRRAEASAYLKEVWGISRSPRTLAKMACVGGGPLVVYDRRTPLYTEPNLDGYARSVLSPPVANTSERREQLAAA